ncbi:MAG: D-alanyl-D-alanine carboxypeptidase family protein [Oscillospiraceae bacterium]
MLKKIALCIAVMLIFLTGCSDSTGAEEIDGRAVTYITDTLNISTLMTIAEGETVWVKSGGVLSIDSEAKLEIDGALKIAGGGELCIGGGSHISGSGKLDVIGEVSLLEGGCLSLDGTLWVGATGAISGSGSIEVNGLFSDISCFGRVTANIIPPEPVCINGVTTVGGVLIVNKQYGIPQDYGSGLLPDAYSAYLSMKKASGYDMTIVSGYRSYEQQAETFENWCDIDGYDKAIYYSAEPGHSEHQTGLALDISSLEVSYGETDEGRWLAENCYKFGFIIRYPEDSAHKIGYIYEPWHIRYLGSSTARLVHDSGLTLEEFLGIQP